MASGDIDPVNAADEHEPDTVAVDPLGSGHALLAAGTRDPDLVDPERPVGKLGPRRKQTADRMQDVRLEELVVDRLVLANDSTQVTVHISGLHEDLIRCRAQ